MKFLITGDIGSRKGPRKIITILLLFFLLFMILRLWRELLQIETYTVGSSAVAALEEAHIDLFLYSIIFLVLGSVFYQIEVISPKWRTGLIWMLGICIVWQAIARVALVWTASGLYFYGGALIALHALVVVAMFFVIRHLYA